MKKILSLFCALVLVAFGAPTTPIQNPFITGSSGNFRLASGKTLIVSNSLTLAGTDGTVMTFPTTSATIARTDAANTFTGTQTITTLAGIATITGTTGNMTITSGTGNSRTLALQTTTGGGSATTALLLSATQDATVTGDVTISGGDLILTGSSTITGGAGNMTVTAGTGNSRTLALQTTTSGGSATTALALNATQDAALTGDLTVTGGDVVIGTAASTITGAAGNMTITSGTGASRTMILRTTTSGSSATTALTLGSDQSATFAVSAISPFFVTTNANPADAGAIRLGNAELIGWENSTPGTDLTMTVNSSNLFAFSAGITTTGSLTTGFGGSVGGYLAFGEGTATTAAADTVGFMAPTNVTTAFHMTLPVAPATGYMKNTGTSDPSTISFVASIPTTDIAAGALNLGNNLLTAGTIDVGNTTDTTISRSAAGVLAVEGNIVSQVNPRITASVSSATPTYNTDTCDVVNITAQAVDITSMVTNKTGTPANFQQLEFRILGTAARAITWGADFASGIATLPTTTITTKTLYVYFEFDSVTGDWMCQATGSYP